MELAGKTLRRRLLTALAVLVVLVLYDYVTGSTVQWTINLLVPVLFFVVSLTADLLVQRWLDGRE